LDFPYHTLFILSSPTISYFIPKKTIERNSKENSLQQAKIARRNKDYDLTQKNKGPEFHFYSSISS